MNILKVVYKSTTTFSRTLTIKLVAGDKIKVVINTGTGTDIGLRTLFRLQGLLMEPLRTSV